MGGLGGLKRLYRGRVPLGQFLNPLVLRVRFRDSRFGFCDAGITGLQRRLAVRKRRLQFFGVEFGQYLACRHAVVAIDVNTPDRSRQLA